MTIPAHKDSTYLKPEYAAELLKPFLGDVLFRFNREVIRLGYFGFSEREACGIRREWRFSKDSHGVTLAFRFDGNRYWEPVIISNK